MARVLVTRPEPGATRTAAALAAVGHEAVVRPLMDTEALDWAPPEGDFDAVMLTSAAGALHAGAGYAVAGADPYRQLPTLCVGEACAAAARASGFERAEAVGGDVAAVLARAAADGMARLLHLAGEDRTAVFVPEGLSVVVREVYRARLLPLAEPGAVDVVMLYSVRSAAHFAMEWEGRERALDVVAMSAAVAVAAGADWRRVIVAAAPNEASMLAALADAGL